MVVPTMEPRSWEGIYLMVFWLVFHTKITSKKDKMMVLVDGCAYHGTKELGGDLSDVFLVKCSIQK
jgi:hypothetical protein